MTEAVVIFPHQLFERHPALSRGREVWYVEDDRFFSDFRFHKKKLLLHRDFFGENPRHSVMVRQLDRMDRNRLRKPLHRAEDFLSGLG